MTPNLQKHCVEAWNIGTLIENKNRDRPQRSSYTLFWSGQAVNEVRDAGVGFDTRATVVMKVESLPRCV